MWDIGNNAMKSILITGADSYIGTSVEAWLKRFLNEYRVDTLDMIRPEWREYSFKGYDVVFHVAGVAHQRETKKNEDLYYKINYKLAIEVAKKARNEGVGQFIILSSMSVYGLNQGVVTKDSIPDPKTFYGKAKWMADCEIEKMQSKDFLVSILRPPMVYGRNCKGNYQMLRKLAIKSPVFAEFKNERSMIYIDNLSEFVKKVIDQEQIGIFQPQNREYVSTTEMVREISNAHQKVVFFTRLFNPIIYFLKQRVNIFQKVFGNLVYEKCDLCDTVGFKESIIRAEGE